MTKYLAEAVSPEDVALIQKHGVPHKPSPLFVEFQEHGTITITPRGVRLYRLACLLHGLNPEPVMSVHDVESLLALTFKIQRARAVWQNGDIDKPLLRKEVPLRSRALVEAARFGTTEDLHNAMEQRLLCDEAGANVIPVNFRPRKGA